MKTMKKLWTAICSFIFALALGLGITLNVNVTAKAATAQNVNITWAAIQYEGDTPTKYAFVLKEGITTPENYTFDVYFDGQRVPAYTIAGHNLIYVDYANFPSDVNEVHLFKLPAGTYYQSGAYVSADCTLLLKNAGWNNGADRFDILSYERINDAAFGFGLNMVDWALGASSNSALYVSIEGGSAIPYGGDGTAENWDVSYAPLGNSVWVNGVATSTGITKTHANEFGYMSIPGVANAGDTLTVDGWFYNSNNNKAFCIEETTFKFDGQAWNEVGVPEYDLVLSATANGGDANGIYASMAANDIPVKSDDTWAYTTHSCGNKGVLYNGSAINAPLHKWSVGDWYVNLSAAGKTASAGDVVTIFGWFYCNGDGTQKHVKIRPTTFTFNGTTWSQEDAAISVSLHGTAVETQQLYVMPGEATSAITATATGSMLTDTTVTTVYENGAVEDGKFVLRAGESSSVYSVTFSVKDENNVVYKKEMAVRVGFEDFVMESGAAVRVLEDGESAEANGLRFIAEMSKDTYENLKAQNASFGMIIVPRDYITNGYELTVNNLFGENAKYSGTAAVGASQGVRRMLHLEDLTASDKDGDGRYEIYGAISNILVNNLTREFVGIAYVQVNGTYILASYYANDMENNTRSIYYVSQKAIDENDHADAVRTAYVDTYDRYLSENNGTYWVTYTIRHIKTANGIIEIEEEEIDDKLNTVVEVQAKEFDGFTLTSAATLTGKLYANKPNVFNFYYKDASAPSYDSVAWYYPTLDSSNGYDNEHNDAIAQTMKAAGYTTVNLAGKNSLIPNSDANIEATKQIIAMFNRNGLKSVVYTSNAGANEYFGSETLPDFSDCAGFAGLLVWDEPNPTTSAMNRLAEYAQWFNSAYGESTEEMPFMVNLLPSYSSYFSSNKTGDYTTYADYIKAYCDIVLSQVNGTKYLSMDSYPIMADGTLQESFLYDLAVLKAYGIENDAFVHACLQSSGWNEGNTTQNKAPTEEQMRLQLYTALAFGMDSVSWFTYSPLNDTITDQTPVDFEGNKNETVYNAMQAVNADLAAFGSLYKTYDWKGVIMSSPAKGTNLLFGYVGQDAQYNAYDKVKSESLFTKYLLSANNTKTFSSVSGSGNYIIGVMEDANGNEAFTVVNYSAIQDNKTLALTLNGATTADYTIYIDGVAEEVEIGTSGYTLNLQPGQGAFIVSASTQLTATFKNWDGTVLQSSKVAYGTTPVYTGATPTREGYEFAGWSPEIGAITTDKTYTAQFAQRYTVTFEDYDGTVIDTKSVLGGNTVEPVTPTHDTYIFKAWTKDGVAFDFNTEITEDITLVATWQMLVNSVKPTQKIYTFTSTSDSNVTTSARFETVGNKADTWYQDDQGNAYGGFIQATFDTADGAGWVVLPKINYAMYSEVSFSLWGSGAANAVQVSINGNGATLDNTGNIYYVVEIHGKSLEVHNMNGVDTLFTATLTDAQYNGTEGLKLDVTENGWSCVQISHILGTQAYEMVDVGSYTVTFTNMVGEDIVQTVFTGNKVEQPANPTRDGYVFGGWYTEDGVAFDFDANLSENTVVVAKWYILTDSVKATEKIYTYTSAADLAITGNLNKSIGTRGDDWYQDDQGVNYDGYYSMTFDMGDGDYTATLTKIPFVLYSEVSFGLYTGIAGTISITVNGQTCSSFVSDGFYVVEIQGKNLNIHKMNEPANVLLTTTLTDAQYNGTEALTLNVTESGWNCVQISHILGTQAYEMEDAMACNLTADSTVNEYVAYVGKVNGFTAYEKANYVEPAIVATLRAKYAGTSKIYTYTSAEDLAVTGTLNKGVGTRGDDWYQDDQGVNYDGYYNMTFDLGDGDYTITLSRINYSVYSEVSFGLYTGIAGTISISINGQTCSSFVSDGFYVVEIQGRNLNIHKMNEPANVLLTTTLTDAQYNGLEGLTLNVTESGWNCVQISHILGTLE